MPLRRAPPALGGAHGGRAPGRCAPIGRRAHNRRADSLRVGRRGVVCVFHSPSAYPLPPAPAPLLPPSPLRPQRRRRWPPQSLKSPPPHRLWRGSRRRFSHPSLPGSVRVAPRRRFRLRRCWCTDRGVWVGVCREGPPHSWCPRWHKSTQGGIEVLIHSTRFEVDRL